MGFQKLVAGLCGPAPQGVDPAAFARMGFLHWLGEMRDDADTAAAARGAMIRLHPLVANAPAMTHFRALLRQAALPPMAPRRRGGRLRARR